MAALALAAVLAAAPAASLPPAPELAPGPALAAALARWEAAMSSSLTARRLLASTRRAPRLETRRSRLSEPIAARLGESPAIIIDARRLSELSDDDAEVLLSLALARLELASPITVLEAEHAAEQTALLFCVQRAAADPAGFGARLLRARRGALGRAARLLGLFERSPREFYRTVEAELAPEGATRLFRLEQVSFLAGTGESQRLREALAGYDGAGAATLRVALERWRRAAYK